MFELGWRIHEHHQKPDHLIFGLLSGTLKIHRHLLLQVMPMIFLIVHHYHPECLVWSPCRDLDQASMEAVVSLLAGLPLQPEEGDGVELMEAKSQLFLKYGANFRHSNHLA